MTILFEEIFVGIVSNLFVGLLFKVWNDRKQK